MANIRTYSDAQVREAVPAATCWADVMEAIGKPRGRGARDVKLVASRLGLDTTHLDGFRRPAGKDAEVWSASPREGNTSSIGSRTEGIILAALIRAGKTILLPFGDGHRYDLAIDDQGRLVRVQCKTAGFRNGVITFHGSSQRRDLSRIGYRGDADVFGVYCPPLDKVYIVPVSDVYENEGRLRIAPTRNNQASRIRWASDYELTNQVA